MDMGGSRVRCGCGCFLTAVAVTVAASPSAAQSVLTGQVRDETALRPVTGAEIAIPAAKVTVRSDSAGAFLLRGIPDGTFEVIVRYPGYEALRVTAAFSSSDTVEADFELRPSAQGLPEVTVTRPAATTTPRLVEFERRRAAGFGAFLTREALAKREHSRLSDVLRSTNGLRLIYRDKGGVAVANNRGGSAGRGGSRCYLRLFVDGVKVYDPSMGGDPPNIDEFTVSSVEAIEIYRGPAETPPEYNATNALCGTMAIWTRSSR
jgi:hypothetical protein